MDVKWHRLAVGRPPSASGCSSEAQCRVEFMPNADWRASRQSRGTQRRTGQTGGNGLQQLVDSEVCTVLGTNTYCVDTRPDLGKGEVVGEAVRSADPAYGSSSHGTGPRSAKAWQLTGVMGNRADPILPIHTVQKSVTSWYPPQAP